MVLFADEFHIGGDELFLIRSQTMSRGDEPIANRDLEMAAVETSLIYICIYIYIALDLDITVHNRRDL